MLAIVIPYYNNRFFKQTLDSLTKQTNKDFSVYIGNDNSPNNPNELIEEYSALLNITYKKFDDNLGKINLSGQWDRCIELIRDEQWIMVLGDDDYLGDNVVEEFYRSLNEVEALNIDVIKFATQVINEINEPLTKKYKFPKLQSSVKHYIQKIDGTGRSSLSEHIFKREAYKKFGFRYYELAWHSDDMAWFEFSNFSDIFTINNAIVYIRLSSENISGKNDNLIDKCKASQDFYEHLLLHHGSEFTKRDKLRFVFLLEYFEKMTKRKNKQINKFKYYYEGEGLLGIIRYSKRTIIR